MSTDYGIDLMVSTQTGLDDFLTDYALVGAVPRKVERELLPGSNFTVWPVREPFRWHSRSFVDHVDFNVTLALYDHVIPRELIQDSLAELVVGLAADSDTLGWQITLESEYLIGYSNAEGIVVNSRLLIPDGGATPYGYMPKALATALEAAGLEFRTEDYGLSIGLRDNEPTLYLTPTPRE